MINLPAIQKQCYSCVNYVEQQEKQDNNIIYLCLADNKRYSYKQSKFRFGALCQCHNGHYKYDKERFTIKPGYWIINRRT